MLNSESITSSSTTCSSAATPAWTHRLSSSSKHAELSLPHPVGQLSSATSKSFIELKESYLEVTGLAYVAPTGDAVAGGSKEGGRPRETTTGDLP